MKIVGANLGEQEVTYKSLSEHIFFNDERQDIVKRLEQFYLGIAEKSKRVKITPFPQENGKAIIQAGMINHRCSNSIEALTAISQYGILASEWFGIPESEREGVFCAFVDRIHYENDTDTRFRQQRARSLNRQRLKSLSNDVILFMDSMNPLMQKLLHLDYFEFERVKQQEPEKLNESYTVDEIKMFESIIEPFSYAGRDFHTNDSLPYCDWSAIPGGIPSSLINGICIKNKQYDKTYIEEVTKLFPNATIFNGELEIVYSPSKKKDEVEARKENSNGFEIEEK